VIILPFRLPKLSDIYFKEIDNSYSKFKFEFDKYYLSLMVGLDKRELGPEKDLKRESFVDHFPEKFMDVKGHIIGLLIDAELDRRGVSNNDRDRIEGVILSIVDHESNNWLKKEGINILNQYAVGGMSIIWERIPKHSTLEGFLTAYFQEFFPE